MANARRQYSPAEELALTTQVDGYCPLCDRPLFYEKRKQQFKGYELAHIYPLNPRPEELKELKGVTRLCDDVNHPDNLLPLCHSCHKRFDKPRTREEYEHLATLKRALLSKAEQRAIRSEVRLEAEIESIIARLHELEPGDSTPLTLDAKKADDKFDDSLPVLVRRKIKRAIEDYYILIQTEFRELELENPTASELIYIQVRTFYLKQRKLGLSQAVAFTNVVDWLRGASNATTLEAAEIVASFFVQNCEVFE
jgi:hypothetical protein